MHDCIHINRSDHILITLTLPAVAIFAEKMRRKTRNRGLKRGLQLQDRSGDDTTRDPGLEDYMMQQQESVWQTSEGQDFKLKVH